jgi:ubiquinone/menaquinone biosynthesis C-methylase UbiE
VYNNNKYPKNKKPAERQDKRPPQTNDADNYISRDERYAAKRTNTRQPKTGDVKFGATRATTKQPVKRINQSKADTSWEPVADWYQGHVKGDSYHSRVVLPKLQKQIRNLFPQALHTVRVLDIACGQGILLDYLIKQQRVDYTGVDASPALIAAAKEAHPKATNAEFIVADATKLPSSIPVNSFELAYCVLGLQNIANLTTTIQQISTRLVSGGYLVIVLTHPSFRIPKHADWDYDRERRTMYRMVWAYKSELKLPIQERPFKSQFEQFESAVTWSFHRPLETYVKALAGAGLAVVDLEEWTSDKQTQADNPWARAENKARAEIPLFMCITAKKL